MCIRDRAYRAARVRLARINAALAENISGVRIIQIFGREKEKFQEFDRVNHDYLDASMRELKVYAVFRPAMNFISSFALALLIWFGGRRVLGGTLEFGVLFAFTNYLEQFFRPINDLTEKYNICLLYTSRRQILFARILPRITPALSLSPRRFSVDACFPVSPLRR